MPDEVSNGVAPLRRAARGPSPGGSSRQRSRAGSAPPRSAGPGARVGSSDDQQEVARARRSGRRRPRRARRCRRAATRSSFCIFIASTTRSCWPATTASPGVDRHATRPARDDGTDLGRPAHGRAAARPRRGPLAEGGSARRLDLDLEPPAVDDDLAPGDARTGDRRLIEAPSARSGRTRAWVGAVVARRAAARRGSTTIGARPACGRRGREPDRGRLAESAGPVAHDGRGRRPRAGPAWRQRSSSAAAVGRCRSWPARTVRPAAGAVAPAPSSAVEPGRQHRPAAAASRARSAGPSQCSADPAGRQVGGRERLASGRRTGGTAGSSGCRAISVSSRARAEAVDGASADRAAWTMTLATRLSYSARDPIAGLDSRCRPGRPGPAGIDPAADPARASARSRGPGPRPRGGPRWRGRPGSAAARPRRSAAVRERPPGGQPELLADDVEARTRARSRRARPGAGC